MTSTSADVFKPVVGAEGLYEVSNTGKVRSVPGGNRSGKELKQTTAPKGYKQVSLFVRGQGKTHRVHRIVATAFIDNPEQKPCINHIDGNPANNHVSNLEWCTYSENNYHSYRVLGNKSWHAGKINLVDKNCKECQVSFTSPVWRFRKFCSLNCALTSSRRLALQKKARHET